MTGVVGLHANPASIRWDTRWMQPRCLSRGSTVELRRQGIRTRNRQVVVLHLSAHVGWYYVRQVAIKTRGLVWPKSSKRTDARRVAKTSQGGIYPLHSCQTCRDRARCALIRLWWISPTIKRTGCGLQSPMRAPKPSCRGSMGIKRASEQQSRRGR